MGRSSKAGGWSAGPNATCMGQTRWISTSGAEAGGEGIGWAGLAQLFFHGAWGWEPDCGGFMVCGRWEEEAADVGRTLVLEVWQQRREEGSGPGCWVERKILSFYICIFYFGGAVLDYFSRMKETRVCWRRQPMKRRP